MTAKKKSKSQGSEKKSLERARVPTGISSFDGLIEKGFKKGTTNLIAGGAGSGKTIFAIEFLYNGVTKYNENALYITFEEKKESVYSDMLRFGWNLQKLEDENKFFFLQYTPEQVKKVLIEGGGIVESIIQKNNIKRIVIDSITSFSLLYQEELSKKEAALALIDLINRWKCTAVLTSQEESGDNLFITAALEFEVDSIMILYNGKIDGERVRAMEILKMRGTKHTNKTFKIEINDSGISLSPNKKITFPQ